MSLVSSLKCASVAFAYLPRPRAIRTAAVNCAGLIAASVFATWMAGSYLPLCALQFSNDRASLVIPHVVSSPDFKAEAYRQVASGLLSQNIRESVEETEVLDEAPAMNVGHVPIPRPRPAKLIARAQSEQNGLLRTLSKMFGAQAAFASLKDRTQ
jgi:hypothetical protein